MIKNSRFVIACILIALVISLMSYSYVYNVKASVLFQDGFETGNFGTWVFSNGQITNAYKHSGNYAASFTGWPYYCEKTYSGYNQLYMGCYTMIPSFPNTNNEIAFLFFFDSSWDKHSAIGFINDGGKLGLQLHQMVPNDDYRSYYFNLQTYTWYWVELECTIAKSGEARVWLDGKEVMNITNIDTSNWNINLQLFGPQYQDSQQKTVYLDDCVISTTYYNPTLTPTPTPTNAPTPTASPTATPSPTQSPSPTPTISPTPSPTATPSPTPTLSPTPTATSTPSPSLPMKNSLKVDSNVTITGADLRKVSSTSYNFYITIVKSGTNHINAEIAKTILPQVSYLRVYINNTNKPFTYVNQEDKWVIDVITT